MNLFYEDFPEIVSVGGEPVRIITDFREYIRLLDMLKCRELTVTDKYYNDACGHVRREGRER